MTNVNNDQTFEEFLSKLEKLCKSCDKRFYIQDIDKIIMRADHKKKKSNSSGNILKENVYFEPFNYVPQLSHINNGLADTQEIITYGSKCGFDDLNFDDSFQLASNRDISLLHAYLIKIEEFIPSLIFLMQTLKSTTTTNYEYFVKTISDYYSDHKKEILDLTPRRISSISIVFIMYKEKLNLMLRSFLKWQDQKSQCKMRLLDENIFYIEYLLNVPYWKLIHHAMFKFNNINSTSTTSNENMEHYSNRMVKYSWYFHSNNDYNISNQDNALTSNLKDCPQVFQDISFCLLHDRSPKNVELKVVPFHVFKAFRLFTSKRMEKNIKNNCTKKEILKAYEWPESQMNFMCQILDNWYENIKKLDFTSFGKKDPIIFFYSQKNKFTHEVKKNYHLYKYCDDKSHMISGAYQINDVIFNKEDGGYKIGFKIMPSPDITAATTTTTTTTRITANTTTTDATTTTTNVTTADATTDNNNINENFLFWYHHDKLHVEKNKFHILNQKNELKNNNIFDPFSISSMASLNQLFIIHKGQPLNSIHMFLNKFLKHDDDKKLDKEYCKKSNNVVVKKEKIEKSSSDSIDMDANKHAVLSILDYIEQPVLCVAQVESLHGINYEDCFACSHYDENKLKQCWSFLKEPDVKCKLNALFLLIIKNLNIVPVHFYVDVLNNLLPPDEVQDYD